MDSTSDEYGPTDSATLEVHVISLPAVFEGEVLSDIHQELKQRLSFRSVVILDAVDIVEISTAAVQLLLSAAISFEAEGLRLTYRNPSDALIDAFSDLGLYAHLASRIDLGSEG